jgi:hypothetical protein
VEFKFYGFTLRPNVIIKAILSICYRQHLSTSSDIKFDEKFSFKQVPNETPETYIVAFYSASFVFPGALAVDDLLV